MFFCESFESIVNPGSVKSIGKEAFSRCVNLKNVIISEGVESIGYRAFEECESLESITIPSSLVEIGYTAFCGCDSLVIKVEVGNKKIIKELEDEGKYETTEKVKKRCKW